MRPHDRCTEKHSQRFDPPLGRKGDAMLDISDVKAKKPYRTTEMQVGDTVFTIVSVESDRARERLYDKVKRMILNSEIPPATEPPMAA